MFLPTTTPLSLHYCNCSLPSFASPHLPSLHISTQLRSFRTKFQNFQFGHHVLGGSSDSVGLRKSSLSRIFSNILLLSNHRHILSSLRCKSVIMVSIYVTASFFKEL